RHTAQYLTLVPGAQVIRNPEAFESYFVRFCPLCDPALIVVDGIPVDTMDDIPPEVVESIDVLKFARAAAFGMRGSDGVISITTRGGEINDEIEKLNQTVYTPLGYQKPVEFYSPKYETLEAKHQTVPDYRTTIFWKPDVVISDDDEEATFEFYTSDFPTTYSVVIEGLRTDGRIVRQIEKIRVE
ncbi:MAG: TonB-dependent receptor plug domain-containing protein, partial [Tannerella sp.]|nr:TonB-dependent receptor plug domain-containing protein [Tannerella sp.]